MAEPVLPTTARILLARTARVQREGRAPSLVAGVVRDGGLAWSAGRGDVAEPHTDVQYRLGSISKTVTAVVVMRLRDEGRLALDDPLERHLPGTPLGDRTVGQLLSHLAGRRGGEPRRVVGARARAGRWPTSRWARSTSSSGAARRFHYSNLGFGLLGELVARLRGTLVGRRRPHRGAGAARHGAHHARGRSAAGGPGRAVHPWADVVLPEPEHHAGRDGRRRAALGDADRPRPRSAPSCSATPATCSTPATLEEMTVPAGVDSSSPGLVGLRARRPGAARGRPHAGRPRRLDARLPRRGLRRPGRADRRGLAGQHHQPAWTRSCSACWPTCGPHEPRIVEPVDALARRRCPSTSSACGSGARRPYGAARGRPAACCTWVRCPGAAGRASRFPRRDDGAGSGLDGYYAGETLRIAADHLDLGTFVFTRTPYDPAAPVPGGVDEARLALSPAIAGSTESVLPTGAADQDAAAELRRAEGGQGRVE